MSLPNQPSAAGEKPDENLPKVWRGYLVEDPPEDPQMPNHVRPPGKVGDVEKEYNKAFSKFRGTQQKLDNGWREKTSGSIVAALSEARDMFGDGGIIKFLELGPDEVNEDMYCLRFNRGIYVRSVRREAEGLDGHYEMRRVDSFIHRQPGGGEVRGFS